MDYVSDQHFAEKIELLSHSPELKAYTLGVLRKFVISTQDDMSTESVSLEFLEACRAGSFVKFQRVGDWSLWVTSFSPRHPHADLIKTLGQQSYAACFRLIDWAVYRELALELPRVTRAINTALFGITPWV